MKSLILAVAVAVTSTASTASIPANTSGIRYCYKASQIVELVANQRNAGVSKQAVIDSVMTTTMDPNTKGIWIDITSAVYSTTDSPASLKTQFERACRSALPY